jgi:DNA-nicking Smr family endonuclease
MGKEPANPTLDSDRDEAPSVAIPIDGVLDLHTFAPSDAKSLVSEYLEECAQRGIQQARIIHGKGQGVLRRIVHGVLDRHPRVLRYALADGSGGSWGATVVELRTS